MTVRLGVAIMTSFRATFCPDCGSKLGTQWFEGKDRPYCATCDRIVFQRPIPCANVAVIDGDHVLLIKRTNPPYIGKWALPGGVIEAGEPPVEAAARELHEETGLDVSPPELTLITGYAAAAPQCWYNAGYTYAVLSDAVSREPTAGGDASDARFWSLNELRSSNQELRPEPDDAAHIQTAVNTIR